MHFVSQALAARGHHVETISVGYSHLTYFKRKEFYQRLVLHQRNRFVETAPRYRSACYLPPLHPFSSQSALLNAITAPFFRLYGRMLPGFMKKAILRADIVAIESGTAIAFFEAARRINRQAQIVYFCRDRLDTVGASRYLQRLEERIAPHFDRIIVPSPRMAEHFQKTRQVVVIPQGIDKKAFDDRDASPYPAGSRNGVVVGNMLFDKDSMLEIALHAPDIAFHIFGSGIPTGFPKNVTVYGERSFQEIIPYIKFADFGVAPYRLDERELYLVESSLKLQQYSYCLLPILAPELMAGSRENIVSYDRHNETNWAGKVHSAATMPHEPIWRNGIHTWDEIAKRIEVECERD